jgi:predicted ATPase
MFNIENYYCRSYEFVGREREIKLLNYYLDKARNGCTQLCFITGQAGSGKSALLREFTEKAQEIDENLIVAIGSCNAQTGIGDPYLPFMELLTQLTGDVKAKLESGSITDKSARRLKDLTNISTRTLVEYAPSLIGAFIPGSSIVLEIAKTAAKDAGWLDKLDQCLEENKISNKIDRDRILEEYTNLLVVLSKHCPLVLILDDMQWADTASIDMLFHLALKLKNSRIFLIGAYRPDDVAIGRSGSRHPLTPILNEIKRAFGDIWIDLDQVEDIEKMRFVSSLIDTEPNSIDNDFRKELYLHTGGHPLFTVELLRDLEIQGMLRRDEKGSLVVVQEINWNILPSRVEGVIEERIGRLEEDLREILTIASVEGQNFTAQIVGRIQQVQERELLKKLSRELEKCHLLVREGNTEKVGKNWVSHYSFSHALFQQYLYEELTDREKMIFHGEVAKILEELYAGQTELVSLQLARHYDLAGESERAVEYLKQNGMRALKISAYEEALDSFRRALELIKELPENNFRDQLELEIQVPLSTVLKAIKGWDSPEVLSVYLRARELCDKMDMNSQLSPVLFGLWAYYLTYLELNKANDTARECLDIGIKSQDSDTILQAHIALGNTKYWMGSLEEACEHMEKVYELYDQNQQKYYLLHYGQDPRVLALMFTSLASSLLGKIDRASQKQIEMLELAEELSHPFSKAIALQAAAWMDYHMRNPDATLKHADMLIKLSKEHHFPFYQGVGIMFRGWAYGMICRSREGVSQIQDGFNKLLSGKLLHSLYSLLLAEVYHVVGETKNGLEILDNGIKVAYETNELCYEAELHRLKGELLFSLSSSNIIESEVNFQKAVDTSHKQKAKLLELRAILDLCPLLRLNGHSKEARSMLLDVYSLFPENSRCLDIIKAKEFLEECESDESPMYYLSRSQYKLK